MRCFLCDKPIKSKAHLVDTRDDQLVFVGPDCFKKVVMAGENGYGGQDWKEGHVKCFYPIKAENLERHEARA